MGIDERAASAARAFPGVQVDAAAEQTSVAEAAALFLASLVGKSPRTVATYASGLRRFGEHLEDRGLKAATLATVALTESCLQEFQSWLVRGYGREDRATITTYVSGVRAFLRFLTRRHLLAPTVSFEAIREQAREAAGRASYHTPRIDGRLPLVVLYVKQMPLPDPGRAHQAYIEALRDRALILTLFATGMRREEGSRLDRADVDDGWSAQAIIRGKGERERMVFFSDEALLALRAYFTARGDSYSPAFIRHDRARGTPRARGANYRLSPQSIWKTVKKVSKLAEVPLTTHDFRHSKATVLLNQGAKLSEVQDILGHASPETTKKIYAHYETQHLRDAFDRYSLSAEQMAERLRDRGSGAGT